MKPASNLSTYWKNVQQSSGAHYIWSGKSCWRPNTCMPLNAITFFKDIFLHKFYWILKHTRILRDIPTDTPSALAAIALFIISLLCCFRKTLQGYFKLNRHTGITLLIKLQPKTIFILSVHLNFSEYFYKANFQYRHVVWMNPFKIKFCNIIYPRA